MKMIERLPQLQVVGGRLCLNFVNTVSSWMEEPLREYFLDIDDYVLWAQHFELLSSGEAKNVPGQRPDQIELDTILGARNAMHDVFAAIAGHIEPTEKDMSLFNRQLQGSMGSLTLSYSNQSIHTDWQVDDPIEHSLAVIWKSAYELLTLGELRRLKMCGACGWLYYDQSKNNSRRWCDMQTCGSADKAKRYYHRRKTSDHQDTPPNQKSPL